MARAKRSRRYSERMARTTPSRRTCARARARTNTHTHTDRHIYDTRDSTWLQLRFSFTLNSSSKAHFSIAALSLSLSLSLTRCVCLCPFSLFLTFSLFDLYVSNATYFFSFPLHKPFQKAEQGRLAARMHSLVHLGTVVLTSTLAVLPSNTAPTSFLVGSPARGGLARGSLSLSFRPRRMNTLADASSRLSGTNTPLASPRHGRMTAAAAEEEEEEAAAQLAKVGSTSSSSSSPSRPSRAHTDVNVEPEWNWRRWPSPSRRDARETKGGAGAYLPSDLANNDDDDDDDDGRRGGRGVGRIKMLGQWRVGDTVGVGTSESLKRDQGPEG